MENLKKRRNNLKSYRSFKVLVKIKTNIDNVTSKLDVLIKVIEKSNHAMNQLQTRMDDLERKTPFKPSGKTGPM